MLVKEKIAVLITTFQRPDMLLALLKDILQQSREFYEITLIIAVDGRQPGYDYVYRFIRKKFGDNQHILIHPTHCGKSRYWELVSMLYSQTCSLYSTRGIKFDYFIQLPDDVRLDNLFFSKAIDQFNAIEDPNKICLNLLNDGRQQTGWTGVEHTKVVHKGYSFINTGWVDMCFISTARFFDEMSWKIKEIPVSWSGNPEKSSGVGMQISRKLVNKGYTMYMVSNALVAHGMHNSQMHPEHRKRVPLVSVTRDPVICGMATIPGREKSLLEAVDSLINQVDELHITLNGYTEVPEFLKHSKISTRVDPLNSLGDAAKFNILGKTGYLFTVDDDIIYPDDYVDKMIQRIELYNRKAIITHHGRRMIKKVNTSYYHCHVRMVKCKYHHFSDEFIHIPGTGVSAFHSSTIALTLSDFKASNMSDIWLGVAAQKYKVPIVAAQHKSGWIRESTNYDNRQTIYALLQDKDQYQVDVVNSINWVLYDKMG